MGRWLFYLLVIVTVLSNVNSAYGDDADDMEAELMGLMGGGGGADNADGDDDNDLKEEELPAIGDDDDDDDDQSEGTDTDNLTQKKLTKEDIARIASEKRARGRMSKRPRLTEAEMDEQFKDWRKVYKDVDEANDHRNQVLDDLDPEPQYFKKDGAIYRAVGKKEKGVFTIDYREITDKRKKKSSENDNSNPSPSNSTKTLDVSADLSNSTRVVVDQTESKSSESKSSDPSKPSSSSSDTKERKLDIADGPGGLNDTNVDISEKRTKVETETSPDGRTISKTESDEKAAGISNEPVDGTNVDLSSKKVKNVTETSPDGETYSSSSTDEKGVDVSKDPSNDVDTDLSSKKTQETSHTDKDGNTDSSSSARERKGKVSTGPDGQAETDLSSNKSESTTSSSRDSKLSTTRPPKSMKSTTSKPDQDSGTESKSPSTTTLKPQSIRSSSSEPPTTTCAPTSAPRDTKGKSASSTPKPKENTNSKNGNKGHDDSDEDYMDNGIEGSSRPDENSSSGTGDDSNEGVIYIYDDDYTNDYDDDEGNKNTGSGSGDDYYLVAYDDQINDQDHDQDYDYDGSTSDGSGNETEDANGGHYIMKRVYCDEDDIQDGDHVKILNVDHGNKKKKGHWVYKEYYVDKNGTEHEITPDHKEKKAHGHRAKRGIFDFWSSDKEKETEKRKPKEEDYAETRHLNSKEQFAYNHDRGMKALMEGDMNNELVQQLQWSGLKDSQEPGKQWLKEVPHGHHPVARTGPDAYKKHKSYTHIVAGKLRKYGRSRTKPIINERKKRPKKAKKYRSRTQKSSRHSSAAAAAMPPQERTARKYDYLNRRRKRDVSEESSTGMMRCLLVENGPDDYDYRERDFPHVHHKHHSSEHRRQRHHLDDINELPLCSFSLVDDSENISSEKSNNEETLYVIDYDVDPAEKEWRPTSDHQLEYYDGNYEGLDGEQHHFPSRDYEETSSSTRRVTIIRRQRIKCPKGSDKCFECEMF